MSGLWLLQDDTLSISIPCTYSELHVQTYDRFVVACFGPHRQINSHLVQSRPLWKMTMVGLFYNIPFFDKDVD